MANMPRLLPLVFVAVAGVLALKVITSLNVVPDIFHRAEAFAADAAKKDAPKDTAKDAKPVKAKAAKGGGEVNKDDDPTQSYSVDPALKATAADASASPAAATAPAVAGGTACATSINDLAAQAGMSPNELNVLQNLAQRRAQLDQREAQLDSRGQLIQAADDKLDARITQLTTLKSQIQGLIDQANKTSTDDTQRLVKVYEAMKPKDAAAVLTTMDDSVRLPIAAGMKDRALAAVLGAMAPDAARELTEKLSNRMKAAGGLQQQLDKVTGNGPAATAPTPAAAGAKPATPAKTPAVAAAKPKA
jgi:flagellar motility protein MotE (MotC chaperone)